MASGETIRVSRLGELRAAVTNAKPGTRIEIAPGEYAGGFYATNLRGEEAKPILITAADPKNPPVLKGGVQLVDAMHVELSDLVLSGFAGNAIAIDDGGSYDTPAGHVTLRRLRITDIGPKGNFHAVKYAGVDDFLISDCHIERWGVENGIGVDAVGCHRGVIENCSFIHNENPEKSGAVGIQVKGACSGIVIRNNRFVHCGGRGINIGGSTGEPFFRPPLASMKGERYEAKDIVVENNTIIGGDAAIAFPNTDGAIVRHNTIYQPQRWAFRILQETTSFPGFVPSRNGVVKDNLIAFRSDHWVEGGINIGPGTSPESFSFSHNFWYCVDAPAKSRPTLPTPETGGVYGNDPKFIDAAGGNLKLSADSPATGFGAP